MIDEAGTLKQGNLVLGYRRWFGLWQSVQARGSGMKTAYNTTVGFIGQVLHECFVPTYEQCEVSIFLKLETCPTLTKSMPIYAGLR